MKLGLLALSILCSGCSDILGIDPGLPLDNEAGSSVPDGTTPTSGGLEAGASVEDAGQDSRTDSAPIVGVDSSTRTTSDGGICCLAYGVVHACLGQWACYSADTGAGSNCNFITCAVPSPCWDNGPDQFYGTTEACP